MVITSTDICNAALGHVKQKSIASMEESTENARRCKQYYTACVEAVLRAHNWSFAKMIEPMSLINDTIIGWDYLYQYPGTCVMIRKIYNEGSVNSSEPDKYTELNYNNQKAIACDIDDAYIEYTSNNVSESLYDAIFVEALQYKLASIICAPLTGNDNRGKELVQAYQMQIDEAKRINKSETNTKRTDNNIFVDAR